MDRDNIVVADKTSPPRPAPTIAESDVIITTAAVARASAMRSESTFHASQVPPVQAAQNVSQAGSVPRRR